MREDGCWRSAEAHLLTATEGHVINGAVLMIRGKTWIESQN